MLLQFLAKGFTAFPCSEIYAGSKPFSEIETKSMSEYIESISEKFYTYISFHSYSQLLMHPYGYTKEHLDNYEDLVIFSYLISYSECAHKNVNVLFCHSIFII